MRRQVVDSECDSCHRTEQQDLSEAVKRGKYVLPKGWMRVQGFTSTVNVFEVDLCTECKLAVMEAVGKGHRVRATSQSA